MSKKDKKFSENKNSSSEQIFGALHTACEGLIYISETDSPIVPFIGNLVKEVSAKTILEQANSPSGETIEEVSFDDFFAKLTAVKDWFGERETARAKKFLDLKRLMEENLTDLKVFRIGEIRIKIYLAGLDQNGRLLGVKTDAVET